MKKNKPSLKKYMSHEEYMYDEFHQLQRNEAIHIPTLQVPDIKQPTQTVTIALETYTYLMDHILDLTTRLRDHVNLNRQELIKEYELKIKAREENIYERESKIRGFEAKLEIVQKEKAALEKECASLQNQCQVQEQYIKSLPNIVRIFFNEEGKNDVID